MEIDVQRKWPKDDYTVGRMYLDGLFFCNTLEVAEDGEIVGYRMRCEKSKLSTVKALQSVGFETIASGDSYNDLGMILNSKKGFLFRSTEQIKNDYPQLQAFEEYSELLAAIKTVL